VLLVGSRHNLTKLADEDLSLTIGLETVQPSDVVRDLGVWLDSSMRQHVTKSATNYTSTSCNDSVRSADVPDVKSQHGWYSHLQVGLL